MSAGKGAQFLGQRIGQDALVIAELVEQVAARDARIAELEAMLTPRRRGQLKARETKE